MVGAAKIAFLRKSVHSYSYCDQREPFIVGRMGFRASVRSSVRSFVRIIIDFYQEDMKGAETLLGTGSLNYGF